MWNTETLSGVDNHHWFGNPKSKFRGQSNSDKTWYMYPKLFDRLQTGYTGELLRV